MSIEAVSAVDADLARVNAAAQQLAAALAQENTSSDANPSVAQSGRAAVQSAEANLAQAEATLSADQSASATPATSTTQATPAAASTAAPSASHFVTDPGGIVA